MLFSTNFVKENPYSLEYKIGSDVDLYLKAFFNLDIDFRYIDDVIAKFEADSGLGSINENQSQRHAEWISMLDKYIAKQYKVSLSELETYENKYHGILRKVKKLFETYSNIKNKIKKGGKK